MLEQPTLVTSASQQVQPVLVRADDARGSPAAIAFSQQTWPSSSACSRSPSSNRRWARLPWTELMADTDPERWAVVTAVSMRHRASSVSPSHHTPMASWARAPACSPLSGSTLDSSTARRSSSVRPKVSPRSNAVAATRRVNLLAHSGSRSGETRSYAVRGAFLIIPVLSFIALGQDLAELYLDPSAPGTLDAGWLAEQLGPPSARIRQGGRTSGRRQRRDAAIWNGRIAGQQFRSGEPPVGPLSSRRRQAKPTSR